ncbi:flavin-containing monooxygenase [Rhodococcoides yunnanense]|uniref:flavin-containing monooxygenase n=1 Tax=Rhodococcoides yunnanense TaxID=278209 RepID=UPI0009342C8A|nr:NAD(P)/FAD-dependent oxidoreductase [Rhodococcus yunnanensis]
MGSHTGSDELDFDLEALKQKYAFERDRRIRTDADKQYVPSAEDFAGYYESDPWTERAERDPIVEQIDLIILGGGFAGLMAGARAREQGVEDFRIVDMGGDFGGTWYWNRYPGIHCDIESYCYLPLLDELGYVPKQKYSTGEEIFEHCQRIGKHFGLYEKALFQTEIDSLSWDEDSERWNVHTDRGDRIAARHVIVALGRYNRPKLPGIAGISKYQGATFHTARWDYDYTGGDMHGGMDKLADKRVAVIGTGATSIQVIPKLAEDAGHVVVFQRTPSVVAPRGNHETDPQWAKELKPGWARERRENYDSVVSYREPNDIIKDWWTELPSRVVPQLRPDMTLETVERIREIEDYRINNELRAHVDEVVHDPETAAKLKAWYRWNCKRPTFHDGYLETFNRDNVTLVDVSSSKGVERITEKGVVADGVEYPVDAIVFASGFEITSEMRRRYGIETFTGRDGESLYDHWQDGVKTLHGFATNNFPNLYFIGFYQGGVSANVTSMFDDQATHIAYLIGEAQRRGIKALEVSAEAQDAYGNWMAENAVDRSDFYAECTPGYYNNEGAKMVRGQSHIGEVYKGSINEFNDMLAQWRERGDLAGFTTSE